MGVKSWGLIPDSTLLLMPLWANHLIEASVASFIACKNGHDNVRVVLGIEIVQMEISCYQVTEVCECMKAGSLGSAESPTQGPAPSQNTGASCEGSGRPQIGSLGQEATWNQRLSPPAPTILLRWWPWVSG